MSLVNSFEDIFFWGKNKTKLPMSNYDSLKINFSVNHRILVKVSSLQTPKKLP